MNYRSELEAAAEVQPPHVSAALELVQLSDAELAAVAGGAYTGPPKDVGRN